MLTAGCGRTKQATGELRLHFSKIGKKCTSGVWHSGQDAIFLQRTLSIRASRVQKDQGRAILPPIGSNWAAHLGNVGLCLAPVLASFGQASSSVNRKLGQTKRVYLPLIPRSADGSGPFVCFPEMAKLGGRFMRHISRALLIALLVLGFVGLSGFAIAAPNTSTSLGCTVGQLGSPGAAACIRQGEGDIISNKPFVHQVRCGISGMYCCKTQNSGSVTDCEKIGEVKRQPANRNPAPAFPSR